MHNDVVLSLLLTGRDHCYWNERGRIHRERLFHVEEALWFINEINGLRLVPPLGNVHLVFHYIIN